MRIAILGVLLAFVPAAHAQERLLTIREILQVLPGRWIMAHDVDSSGKPLYDCTSAEVLNIRLEWSDKVITYVGWHDDAPNIQYRSIVRAQSKNDDVNKSGAVVVQYEGEERLDAAGNPVVWHLLMTDRDTFYWHREDWEEGGTTAPSHRCPENANVS